MLRDPGVTADALTEVLRAGVCELLAQVIEAEVAGVRAAHEHLKTKDGRRRPVRHGHSRTARSHGTALAMVFKLVITASKPSAGSWATITCNNQLTKIIEGVKFENGIQADETAICAIA